jgi:hypothetical protein
VNCDSHSYKNYVGNEITPSNFVFCRFDFTNANLNNPDLEKVKTEKLPDVVGVDFSVIGECFTSDTYF